MHARNQPLRLPCEARPWLTLPCLALRCVTLRVRVRCGAQCAACSCATRARTRTPRRRTSRRPRRPPRRRPSRRPRRRPRSSEEGGGQCPSASDATERAVASEQSHPAPTLPLFPERYHTHATHSLFVPRVRVSFPTKQAPAWASYLTAAMRMSVLSLLLVVLGRSADRQLASMMTVFSLAGLAGYQARQLSPPGTLLPPRQPDSPQRYQSHYASWPTYPARRCWACLPRSTRRSCPPPTPSAA